MYSRGASTATRSSLSVCESRPARTMCTFMVPPATGRSLSGVSNFALLTLLMIAPIAFAHCETVYKQYVRMPSRRRSLNFNDQILLTPALGCALRVFFAALLSRLLHRA